MSQSPNTTAAVEDSWDASGRATQVVPEQDYPAEQVTAIQLALVSMGYNLTGQSTQAQSHTEGDGVDGVWDDQTRQAVRQFQDDNDLEPTGQLDEDTDEAILRAYALALVASGSDPMFQENLSAPLAAESASLNDVAAQTATPGDIEDLVPGTLPDEPVIDFLDDAQMHKTR